MGTKFVLYDGNNMEHNSFLKDISNDEEISKYINDIANEIIKSFYDKNSKNMGFIIKDEEINKYIGVCLLKPSYYDETAAPIEYAVHQKYRHSDKKYGSKILFNISNFIFNNTEYSRIILEIKYENTPSLKAACNAGFNIDYGLLETFDNEGYKYIPYSKYNPNYNHIQVIDKVKSLSKRS